MNPKAWDILYLKVDIEKPKSIKALMRLSELVNKGFTVKLVTIDELENGEENLQCHERFGDPELWEADIQNIYYPKPGMFDRLRQALDPFGKEEKKG